MHIEVTLPNRFRVGAEKTDHWDKEVVTTVGGHELRNTEWDSPLRSFNVSLPAREATHEDFVAVREIWRLTDGGTHSFNLLDWVDEEVVRVRFDSDLDIQTPKRLQQHRVERFTLREVRDVSPGNTVLPAITGTLETGELLTVSNGTWTGSPVSYARQWTRDGEDIAGATLANYAQVEADEGAMIGCQVIATDADGGETLVFAVEVGPVVAP